MKTSIIFHSVCANTFLMAEAFQTAFDKRGQAAGLFRVADDDWQSQDKHTTENKKIFARMHALAIATPEVMLKSDLVIMGCPTYFGNVSAEMKTFMDAVAVYWFEARLAGKKLAAFTSAGNPEGGGDLCLAAIHTFGKYMGMLDVPVPTNMLKGETCSAYGIIHYSQGATAVNLDEKTIRLIDRFADVLIGNIK